MEIIISLISIFDILTGLLGEVFISLFNLFSDLLLDLCTMETSFTDTFSGALFGSKGLFANSNPSASTTAFPSGNVDPTKLLQTAGTILVLILMIFELFKSMFGEYLKADAPQLILGRGLICTIAIVFYDVWSNAILSIVISPLYKNITEVQSGTVTGDVILTAANCFQALNENMSNWDIAALLLKLGAQSTDLIYQTGELLRMVLFLILCIPLGCKFISFTFEICERYIQIFFITIFGPLCLACGVSSGLETISKRWFSTWINGLMLMCINVFFVKLSILATINFISSLVVNIGDVDLTKDILVPYLAVYALMKIAGDADDIANSLGLDSVGAMGAGSELAAGLLASTHAVKNIMVGDGRKSRGSAGGENLARAEKFSKSKGAALARSLGKKGVIGAAVSAVAFIASKVARGAMIMDMLEKFGGKNAFFDNLGNSVAKIKENMNFAAELRKTGSINGDAAKQEIANILASAGITGKVSHAFMQNGQLIVLMDSGEEVVMRQADDDSDTYGSKCEDHEISENAKKFRTKIGDKDWVGASEPPEKNDSGGGGGSDDQEDSGGDGSSGGGSDDSK